MTEQLGNKRMPWELDSSQNSRSDPEVMRRVNEKINHDLKDELVKSPTRMIARSVRTMLDKIFGGPARVDHVPEERSLLVASKTLGGKRK